MKVKRILSLLIVTSALSGCQKKETTIPLIGTWELVSATTIDKDTTFSTFDPSHKMIKIINPTHFAFLNHSIRNGKDSATTGFTAGGGKYTLVDSVYIENLEYFVDKKWENNKFEFVVRLVGDTLIQKGVEKVEKLGIDHVIIEKYRKIGN